MNPQPGIAGRIVRLGSSVAAGLTTVLAVGSAVFFAFRLLPGDPTLLVLGERATEGERALMRMRLHLDESLLRQWGRFLWGVLHLCLGPSLRRPELESSRIVLDALPSTALLAATSVAMGTVLGVSLGLLSVGARRQRVRATCSRLIGVFASVPLLAFAPAATWVFAVRMRLVPLPADPEAGAVGLLYASALLSIPLSAAVGRVARTSLAEASVSPFLQVARAKGRGEAGVWIVHALPTCVGPIITVVAAQLGALLGGAIVLERLLERRGLGTVVADALTARDLPVLEASVVLAAGLFVVVQAASEWLHGRVDPRAR